MTLFQDAMGDPRTKAAQLADVLAWYGAVGDATVGNAAGFGMRKASVAVAIAKLANHPDVDLDGLYIAGVVHAVGALGSNALRKGESL